MPITCQAYFNDGPAAVESRNDVYVLIGTADKDAALAQLLATAPTTKGTVRLLKRDDPRVQVDYLGPNQFLGNVPYVKVGGPPHTQGERVPGFSFIVGGATETVTHGKSLLSSYPPAGEQIPDWGGAIGIEVDDNKLTVRGVEREITTFEWEETIYHDPADINATYVSILADLAWHINADAFTDAWGVSHGAGTVLFKGCNGQQIDDDRLPITYHYAARPDEANVVVGTITVTTKPAWAYLDVLYKETTVTVGGKKFLVKKPIAAYVHKMYDTGDFSGLIMA